MQRDQAAADVRVADSALRVAHAQVDSDQEAVNVALSAIKQADAALETAKINLGYTKITAPISGRIGRSAITEGAIVTAYQPTPLATIQKFDPIFVDVPQSTAELNRLREKLASGRLKDNGTDKVKIILEDGARYPLEGSLKFRDVTVDPTTGSVILRIVVPNPDGILLPGMFVRAMIDEGVNEQAILIPQQTVLRDPKGNPFTFVVNPAGKAKKCDIAIDRALGDKWLVSSGLAPGNRVIMEGIQKVQMLLQRQPEAAVKATAFRPAGINTAKSNDTLQTMTSSP
jgi:membrane fusion protein (multidrug efflux system)